MDNIQVHLFFYERDKIVNQIQNIVSFFSIVLFYNITRYQFIRKRGIEMRHFFDYDGSMNKILIKLMYVVAANLLFVICCIPIVTIGTSASAMFKVLQSYHDGEECPIIRTFLETLKENLKETVIVWVGLIFIALTLGVNYYLIYHMSGIGIGLIRVFLNLILMAWFSFQIYIFPTIVYFENSFWGHIEFAFRLAVAHLPKTILMLAIQIAFPLLLLWLAQYSAGAILLLLCCGFSLPMYYSSMILSEIFRCYGEE